MLLILRLLTVEPMVRNRIPSPPPPPPPPTCQKHEVEQLTHLPTPPTHPPTSTTTLALSHPPPHIHRCLSFSCFLTSHGKVGQTSFQPGHTCRTIRLCSTSPLLTAKLLQFLTPQHLVQLSAKRASLLRTSAIWLRCFLSVLSFSVIIDLFLFCPGLPYGSLEHMINIFMTWSGHTSLKSMCLPLLIGYRTGCSCCQLFLSTMLHVAEWSRLYISRCPDELSLKRFLVFLLHSLFGIQIFFFSVPRQFFLTRISSQVILFEILNYVHQRNCPQRFLWLHSFTFWTSLDSLHLHVAKQVLWYSFVRPILFHRGNLSISIPLWCTSSCFCLPFNTLASDSLSYVVVTTVPHESLSTSTFCMIFVDSIWQRCHRIQLHFHEKFNAPCMGRSCRHVCLHGLCGTSFRPDPPKTRKTRAKY